MIGDLRLPCYVLEDERRMLTLGGITDGMGLARGGSMIAGMNRLELFVTRERLRLFISKELFERIRSPVVFLTPKGAKAYGYEASVLTDVCDAVLAARAAGKLQRQQLRIAQRCELLTRGLARVGIIALIDEATGYQEIRKRDALHRILEAFIAKELLPWTRRFPPTFYSEMFRLLGWDADPEDAKKPGYVGKLTNALVYEKLPAGVLDELRRRNPVIESKKRRRWRHHQFLTEEVGHPALERHISQVIALMRASRDWKEFKVLFRRVFPDSQGDLDLEPRAV